MAPLRKRAPNQCVPDRPENKLRSICTALLFCVPMKQRRNDSYSCVRPSGGGLRARAVFFFCGTGWETLELVRHPQTWLLLRATKRVLRVCALPWCAFTSRTSLSRLFGIQLAASVHPGFCRPWLEFALRRRWQLGKI